MMRKASISAIIIVLTVILSNFALSAEKTDSIKIKTSAQCELCKDRIEKGLKDIEGITRAVLNLETMDVEAVYNPDIISSDDIRKEITKLGYDADNKPASKKAYNKLPKCCQKGGHK